MTMKRRLQSAPSTKDLSFFEDPRESTKTRKRPRTEQFRKQKAIYEDAIHSCLVFQSELANLTNNNDLQQHPSQRDVTKSTANNIRRHMEGYGKRYLANCQELQSEAQQTIDLSLGFDALSRAIDNNSGHESQCLLSTLNVGHETTSAIKLRIAEYAGVATFDQLDDVQSLSLELQKDGVDDGK
ncbi:unnamed protein product [Cylindrotheca closterium]|uniref:Uncharacterized protein n=1 Tax=Cylindrotheca closterium TaxID=2856 RepID=A0AAD2JMA9_9STRA|nr:unnamed protein product [Cylindrotheca closterium]